MRIYHRLIHIRDQRERHDDIPPDILSHPVFLLTTKFRQHVQAKSSPITKQSPLIVDEEGMLLFSELAALLREQGNRAMVYLVACILERLFGKDTIEDIETIRDDMSIPDIIDGVMSDEGAMAADAEPNDYDEEEAFLREGEPIIEEPDPPSEPQHQPQPLKPSATKWLSDNFDVRPSPSVMVGTSSSTSAFGMAPASSAFGNSNLASGSAMPSVARSVPPAASAFANLKTTPNVFGNWGGSAFGSASSAFGTSSAPPATLGTTGVQSAETGSSFSPFGASTSAPVVSKIGDQGTAASGFGSPFATSSAVPSTTSPAPVVGLDASSSSAFSASQSLPSGFPRNVILPSVDPKAAPTPPTSNTAFSEQKQDRPSATVLNPKATAFSPGKPFGLPSSTTPIQAEKGPTANSFGPSSSSPAASTSMTPTRPILPPINTSPLTLVSASSRQQANLSTSQSAPSLNGSTKHPPLSRQPTMVDGFKPSAGDSTVAPDASTTPQHPPPLRMQPISLPGTPTATSFSSPTKQKSSNLFGWPSIPSISAPDILSPLVMSAKGSLASLPSPPVSARQSVSRLPSMGPPGPSQATAEELQPSLKAMAKTGTSPISPQDIEMASPTAAPMRNGKSKGKGKAPAVEAGEHEARAAAFARTSTLVRGALRRWTDKALERALYNDAVRRSDAYTGQKPKKRQETRPQADDEPEARRTARARTTVRRRVSAKYAPPQTDDELARRLKEVEDIFSWLLESIAPITLFFVLFSYDDAESRTARTPMGTRDIPRCAPRACWQSGTVRLLPVALAQPRE